MKAIPGEFQHALVIADIDKRKIMKVMWKTCAEKRKITLLKDAKEAFESRRSEDSLGKTKVMVSGSFTKDGISESKVDTCGVCSLILGANSALCLQCGKWIHGRCAGMKRVTPRFSRNLLCRKCEGNIGEAAWRERTLSVEVETAREFTYLGDRVSDVEDVWLL